MKFEIKEESFSPVDDLLSKPEVEEAELPKIDAEVDPFEQSIDQTISAQSEKRREHLKAFNHKFTHQLQRVDEMEKEPAYKRKNIQIDDLPHSSEEAMSKFTLSNGNDGEYGGLRDNNSFLHDNVD